MTDGGYVPTAAEQWMLNVLQYTVSEIIRGDCEAVGIAAVDKNGEPTFVFYNKPDDPVLKEALSKLVGIYDMKHGGFQERINAPRNNRSYREN